MLRTAIAAVLVAAATVAWAANTETRAELSQEKARTVLDQAVAANGGAEALRAVEVVRLQLEGQTFPRLQMTTPAPPFEGGSFDETLLIDLEKNRMRLDQKAGGFGFDGDNTVTIVDGTGNAYDNRAKTVTPIPAEQATQQQFVQYHRRLPNLLLRQALDRANSLRYLGEDDFEGRRHEVITFVMPDTQQVALYVDAATGLVSKYELIFVDSLEGVEASEIIFGDYQKVGNYQVPRRWINRQLGEDQTRYTVQGGVQPAGHGRFIPRRGGRVHRSEAGADRPRGESRPARRRRLRDPERRRPEPEHDGRRIRRLRGCGRGAGHERRRRCGDQAHPRTLPGQADPLRRHDPPSRRPHRRHAQLRRRGRDRHHHGRQPAGDRGDGRLEPERPARQEPASGPSSCCWKAASACWKTARAGSS